MNKQQMLSNALDSKKETFRFFSDKNYLFAGKDQTRKILIGRISLEGSSATEKHDEMLAAKIAQLLNLDVDYGSNLEPLRCLMNETPSSK